MQPKLSREPEILKTGPRSYLLLDAATGLRYECGTEEVYLLSLIDGARSLEEIRQDFRLRFGRKLRRRHLLEFLSQFRSLGIVDEVGEFPAGAVSARTSAAAAQAPPSSPMSAGRAGLNRRFDLMGPWLGWLLRPIWIAPTVVLAAIAVTGMVRDSQRWLFQLQDISGEFPFAILIMAMFGNAFFVILPAEILVGVASRKYHGWVRGFRFTLARGIMPTFSCDTDNAIVFTGRHGHWTLLTLRLWVHVAVGSMAAICWFMAPLDSALSMFLLALFLVTTVRLLLRLNVFEIADGYFILSYLLRIGNLREWARAETRAWLTLNPGPRACTDRERFWLRVYGTGTYLLRWLVYPVVAGVVVWYLVTRFHGTGALLSVGLVFLWFRGSLRGAFMERAWLRRLVGGGDRPRIRWLVRGGVVIGVILLGFIPYSQEVGGDCRLIPVRQHGVRAQIAGEVVEMHVNEGDWVEAGALISTLAARETRAAVATTKAELDRARVELELLRAGAREEDIKIAEQDVELWRIQREFAERDLKRLTEMAGNDAASIRQHDRSRLAHQEAVEELRSAEESLRKLQRGAREETIRAAEADVARLSALLAHHEEMLALSEVTTPIAGRIITPNVEERVGHRTEPGDLIAVVHDTSVLRLEVAAEEAAAARVKPDMSVNVRLRGLDGRLVTGRVHHVSWVAEHGADLETERVRSDREARFEQTVVRRQDDDRRVRINVELDEYDEEIVAGMTGYARIVVGTEFLWQALVRPVARFFRVEVWSWLP